MRPCIRAAQRWGARVLAEQQANAAAAPASVDPAAAGAATTASAVRATAAALLGEGSGATASGGGGGVDSPVDATTGLAPAQLSALTHSGTFVASHGGTAAAAAAAVAAVAAGGRLSGSQARIAAGPSGRSLLSSADVEMPSGRGQADGRGNSVGGAAAANDLTTTQPRSSSRDYSTTAHSSAAVAAEALGVSDRVAAATALTRPPMRHGTGSFTSYSSGSAPRKGAYHPSPRRGGAAAAASAATSAAASPLPFHRLISGAAAAITATSGTAGTDPGEVQATLPSFGFGHKPSHQRRAQLLGAVGTSASFTAASSPAFSARVTADDNQDDGVGPYAVEAADCFTGEPDLAPSHDSGNGSFSRSPSTGVAAAGGAPRRRPPQRSYSLRGLLSRSFTQGASQPHAPLHPQLQPQPRPHHHPPLPGSPLLRGAAADGQHRVIGSGSGSGSQASTPTAAAAAAASSQAPPAHASRLGLLNSVTSAVSAPDPRLPATMPTTASASAVSGDDGQKLTPPSLEPEPVAEAPSPVPTARAGVVAPAPDPEAAASGGSAARRRDGSLLQTLQRADTSGGAPAMAVGSSGGSFSSGAGAHAGKPRASVLAFAERLRSMGSSRTPAVIDGPLTNGADADATARPAAPVVDGLMPDANGSAAAQVDVQSQADSAPNVEEQHAAALEAPASSTAAAVAPKQHPRTGALIDAAVSALPGRVLSAVVEGGEGEHSMRLGTLGSGPEVQRRLQLQAMADPADPAPLGPGDGPAISEDMAHVTGGGAAAATAAAAARAGVVLGSGFGSEGTGGGGGGDLNLIPAAGDSGAAGGPTSPSSTSYSHGQSHSQSYSLHGAGRSGHLSASGSGAPGPGGAAADDAGSAVTATGLGTYASTSSMSPGAAGTGANGGAAASTSTAAGGAASGGGAVHSRGSVRRQGHALKRPLSRNSTRSYLAQALPTSTLTLIGRVHSQRDLEALDSAADGAAASAAAAAFGGGAAAVLSPGNGGGSRARGLGGRRGGGLGEVGRSMSFNVAPSEPRLTVPRIFSFMRSASKRVLEIQQKAASGNGLKQAGGGAGGSGAFGGGGSFAGGGGSNEGALATMSDCMAFAATAAGGQVPSPTQPQPQSPRVGPSINAIVSAPDTGAGALAFGRESDAPTGEHAFGQLGTFAQMAGGAAAVTATRESASTAANTVSGSHSHSHPADGAALAAPRGSHEPGALPEPAHFGGAAAGAAAAAQLPSPPPSLPVLQPPAMLRLRAEERVLRDAASGGAGAAAAVQSPRDMSPAEMARRVGSAWHEVAATSFTDPVTGARVVAIVQVSGGVSGWVSVTEPGVVAVECLHVCGTHGRLAG